LIDLIKDISPEKKELMHFMEDVRHRKGSKVPKNVSKTHSLEAI
jgi:hypothetical protein